MALLGFGWNDKGLVRAIKKLPEEVQGAVKEVIREITKRSFQMAKFATPVDRGTLIRGWRMEFGPGLSAKLFNNVSYVRVAEFGGWGNPPVHPTGPHPPGPRTQIARNSAGQFVSGGTLGAGESRGMNPNVSKQAPQGMLRVSFRKIEPEYLALLEEAVDRALAGV